MDHKELNPLSGLEVHVQTTCISENLYLTDTFPLTLADIFECVLGLTLQIIISQGS